MEYNIKAKPTMYNGRQYRSRLEVKWAVFFDLIGWTCEYEPFDLGGWSPDFLIKTEPKMADILVEVKPITEFNENVAKKMESNTWGRGLSHSLLLLGCSPISSELSPNHRICIGWISPIFSETKRTERAPEWYGALLEYHKSNGFDFTREFGDFNSYMNLSYDSIPCKEMILCTRDSIMNYWNESCNRVQWQA